MANTDDVKIIREKVDTLTKQRREVINLLFQVTQHFVTRAETVITNDNIPEDVLSDLDRAIEICVRLHNDVSHIFGSKSTRDSPELDVPSEYTGSDAYNIEEVNPSLTVTGSTTGSEYRDEQHAYDLLGSLIGVSGTTFPDEHTYETLSPPNDLNRPKYPPTDEADSLTVVKQFFDPNIAEYHLVSNEDNEPKYSQGITHERLLRARPDYSEYDPDCQRDPDDRRPPVNPRLPTQHNNELDNRQRLSAEPFPLDSHETSLKKSEIHISRKNQNTTPKYFLETVPEARHESSSSEEDEIYQTYFHQTIPKRFIDAILNVDEEDTSSQVIPKVIDETVPERFYQAMPEKDVHSKPEVESGFSEVQDTFIDASERLTPSSVNERTGLAEQDNISDTDFGTPPTHFSEMGEDNFEARYNILEEVGNELPIQYGPSKEMNSSVSGQNLVTIAKHAVGGKVAEEDDEDKHLSKGAKKNGHVPSDIVLYDEGPESKTVGDPESHSRGQDAADGSPDMSPMATQATTDVRNQPMPNFDDKNHFHPNSNPNPAISTDEGGHVPPINNVRPTPGHEEGISSDHDAIPNDPKLNPTTNYEDGINAKYKSRSDPNTDDGGKLRPNQQAGESSHTEKRSHIPSNNDPRIYPDYNEGERPSSDRGVKTNLKSDKGKLPSKQDQKPSNSHQSTQADNIGSHNDITQSLVPYNEGRAFYNGDSGAGSSTENTGGIYSIFNPSVIESQDSENQNRDPVQSPSTDNYNEAQLPPTQGKKPTNLNTQNGDRQTPKQDKSFNDNEIHISQNQGPTQSPKTETENLQPPKRNSGKYPNQYSDGQHPSEHGKKRPSTSADNIGQRPVIGDPESRANKDTILPKHDSKPSHDEENENSQPPKHEPKNSHNTSVNDRDPTNYYPSTSSDNVDEGGQTPNPDKVPSRYKENEQNQDPIQGPIQTPNTDNIPKPDQKRSPNKENEQNQPPNRHPLRRPNRDNQQPQYPKQDNKENTNKDNEGKQTPNSDPVQGPSKENDKRTSPIPPPKVNPNKDEEYPDQSDKRDSGSKATDDTSNGGHGSGPGDGKAGRFPSQDQSVPRSRKDIEPKPGHQSNGARKDIEPKPGHQSNGARKDIEPKPGQQSNGARPKTKPRSGSAPSPMANGTSNTEHIYDKINTPPPVTSNRGSPASSNNEETSVKKFVGLRKRPDIVCELGVISPSYPANVLFHGYKSETQITTRTTRIYFEKVHNPIAGMYSKHDGYFTAPFKGFFIFHMSVKAVYQGHPHDDSPESSSCVLRAVANTVYEDIAHWSVCTVKHDDWTSGSPGRVISSRDKRYLRKGEEFSVQAFSTAGVWRSVQNFINFFVVQAPS